MGPANLAGPAPRETHSLPELTVADIGNATVVDVRPAEQYAAGHLRGSIGIPFGDQVGVWAGWVLPFDTAVVVVAERGQDVDEVHRQFSRIGFDRVLGVVFELPDRAELVSYEAVRIDEFVRRLLNGDIGRIVDVRAPDEWDAGKVGGSIHRYVPDLYESVADLSSEQPVWLLCASGHRSTIAAAALERSGLKPAVLLGHGVADVLKRLG